MYLNVKINFEFFFFRDRNMKGIRILFGKGKPIKLSSKWNPFTEDLPIWTFTYHPLYFHKGEL